MPVSLDEFTSYFAGAPRSVGPTTDAMADEIQPLLAGLDVLADVGEGLVLTDLLPLDEDDELPPAVPSSLEIDQAVRTLNQTGNSPPEYRRVAQSVWNELTRPLRQWFFLQVAQSLSRHSATTSRSTSEAPAENTTSLRSAGEPTKSVQPISAPPTPEAIDLLRQIAPDEWESYMLSRYAGLTAVEIAELTESTAGEVETWLAVAEASFVTANGDSHE